MKWVRKQAPFKDAASGLYHIDSHECNDPQTHYLHTACRKEIKGHYWDIVEDPPEHECCKDCWNKVALKKKIEENNYRKQVFVERLLGGRYQ